MIVDHIAIRAKDIEKVAKWYQDTIGAEVTHTDKYYIRLSTQNTTIAIIDEKKYPHRHIGVLVDSIDDLPDEGTANGTSRWYSRCLCCRSRRQHD